jgi:hypothetical protein
MFSPLEQTPNEIWNAIVKYACIDGGGTGCALSLVSRHIRAVSHLSRLQAVALKNLADMQSFICELERRAPEDRGVRFVYFIDDTPSDTGPYVDDNTGEDDDFSINHKRGIYWQAAYTHFATLISPTVEVLTVEARQLDYVFPPSCLHFPRLRSLTTSGTSLFNEDYPVPLLPALEHLHLISGIGHHSSSNLFGDILRQQMPELSHLRVAGFYEEYKIAEVLGRMLGIPEYTAAVQERGIPRSYRTSGRNLIRKASDFQESGCVNDGANSKPTLTLRMLIIEPSEIAPGERCGNTYRNNAFMLERINYLVNEYDGYRQVRIMCVLHRHEPEEHGKPGALRRAWEDVVGGGLGAWAVTEDHTRPHNAQPGLIDD